MKHTADFELHRERESLVVSLEIEWSKEEFGRGYVCDSIRAFDLIGVEIELSQPEQFEAMDLFHPDNLPDPTDQDDSEDA